MIYAIVLLFGMYFGSRLTIIYYLVKDQFKDEYYDKARTNREMSDDY